MPPANLWLITGLGNPGKQYERSRHNVGFMAVDRWAARHHLEFSRRRPWAIVAEGELTLADSPYRVILAKPRTFMNLSGDAVIELVKRYQIAIAHTLVVYDDMDLPTGKLRLREKGLGGGHKGIGSIISQLHSQEFPRLRVGISRPQTPSDNAAIGHVLGDFTATEREPLAEALERACDAIDAVLAKGMSAAMTMFNGAGDTPRSTPKS